jgi:uncharacterized protein DUF4375
MRRTSSKILAAVIACVVCVTAWPANKNEETPEQRYAAMLEREYGPLGTTTDQILGHESDQDPVTIFGALVYRINAKPVERRSLVERKLAAVHALQSEVNNGGFDQYFFNDSGDESAQALAGLKEMGSAPGLKLMQRAVNAFPAGKVPTDRAKRQALMEKIRARAQSTWSACDSGFYLIEDLGSLALAYAKKNRAQITLP